VVENGNQIWATLQNNRQIPCELMGSDPLLDLAVLRLDTQEPLELEVVKQGDSSTLFQGQFVFALGAPAGLQNSFTFGVISHKNRYLPTVTFPSSGVSSGSFNTWIQVDTAINHGNSGGPLFNLKGEVIGVNTRTLAQHQNISFALPINAIKDSARTLMSQHQIERAFVGLTLKPISNQKIRGALIEQVLPGSPAETAGIQAQDLLLEVGDHQINVFDESELPLANAILAHLTFNQPHIFLVERQHRRIRSEVTPRQREYFDDQLSTFVSWGFSGIPITQKLREYLGTISADQGIYIMVVEPNSLFARANITSGSVLLAINDQTISSFKDFKEKYDTIIQKKQETSIISIMTTEGLLETRTLQQR
jgi:serine protease Do